MAHDVPCRALVVFPEAGTERIFFADASTGDLDQVRRLFVTGADDDGDGTTGVAIRAEAITGGLDFDIVTPKLLRRIAALGHGNLSFSVIADFDPSAFKTVSLDLREQVADPLWDGGQWDGGQWDGTSGSGFKPSYIDIVGRWLSFGIVEVSSETTTTDSTLGLSGVTVGGAALQALLTTVTPLDRK